MVPINGPKHASDVMVGPTKNKWAATFGQTNQKVVGIAYTMCIGDQRCNVIQRNLASKLTGSAGCVHHQKTAKNGQMAPVVRDFYDATNHNTKLS